MIFRVAIALIAGLLIGALFGLQLSDGTGAGWFIKLKLSDAGELDGLMDEGAYKEFAANEG